MNWDGFGRMLSWPDLVAIAVFAQILTKINFVTCGCYTVEI
jgi:hypothetical protein